MRPFAFMNLTIELGTLALDLNADRLSCGENLLWDGGGR